MYKSNNKTINIKLGLRRLCNPNLLIKLSNCFRSIKEIGEWKKDFSNFFFEIVC